MSIRFVLGFLIGLLVGACIATVLAKSGGARDLAQRHGDE